MTFLAKYKLHFLLGLIIVIGSLLRLYNLNWGAPYYFHPDERNIATAISQLTFPTNLNPHFFAYGSLPIYTALGLGLVQNALLSLTGATFVPTVSFAQAILLLRSLSALFSLLCIPLLYLIGKKIHNRTTGLLAAFLSATSIGLIQYAHFGTFEMWLTILSLLLFLSHLQLWKSQKVRYQLLQAVIFALLVATKISSLALLPLLFILPVLFEKTPFSTKLLALIKQGLLVTFTTVLLYILTNPYSLLDSTSYLNSMTYESAVATGKLEVFYTGEFVKTLPVLYHLLNIYPFLLNPLIFVLFPPALGYGLSKGIRQKQPALLLLCTYTLLLFLSQTFLYVKWTRYLIPTLPFIYLLIAFLLTESLTHLRSRITRLSNYALLGLIGIISSLFALSFFITVYLRPDTRIEAARWAEEHLAGNTPIVSEMYDLGIIPFNERFPSITLYNFYDLDNNSLEINEATLRSTLTQHDVLVLPSQRIVKSRLLHPDHFPTGAAFYEALFHGETEFTTLYITPCDFWCQITYWGDPIFAFEGTVNIFDRPTVFIFGRQDTQ